MPEPSPFRPRALALAAGAALALAPPAVGGAQERPTGSPIRGPATAGALTLADALRRARAAAPTVDLARAGVAVARGRAREETQWANPELLYRREDVNANSTTPGDVFAEASVPFPITPRRLALRGAGREAVARAQADSAALLAQLDADVAGAWWTLLREEALLRIAREQHVALADVATYDSTRAAEGAVAEVVALRARVEADRAALAEVTAVAALARARASLAQLLAMHTDSLLVLSGEAWRQLVGDEVRDPVRRPVPPGGTERPELRGAAAAEREAERRLSAERRALVPDPVLTAGNKTTGPLRYTVLAVGLPLPLFNRNGGARERAAGELLAARATRRAVEARVQREAEAADAARRALQAAPPARGLVARAGEAAQIARAAYREGGITQVELLETQRADAAAREAIVRWAAELRLADVQWRRATGRPQATEESP